MSGICSPTADSRSYQSAAGAVTRPEPQPLDPSDLLERHRDRERSFEIASNDLLDRRFTPKHRTQKRALEPPNYCSLIQKYLLAVSIIRRTLQPSVPRRRPVQERAHRQIVMAWRHGDREPQKFAFGDPLKRGRNLGNTDDIGKKYLFDG